MLTELHKDFPSQREVSSVIHTVAVLPIIAKNIAREKTSDQVLGKVNHFTLAGWPKHIIDTALTPYWARRDELIVEGDCVSWAL